MISEIDLLREDIPRLEKTFGVKNSFVKVLKAQLASLQNKTLQQPQRLRNHPGLLSSKRSQSWKRNESSDKQL
ncbi:MAG: hypothetical protein WAW61_00815 [Methylococcaceae bacterium]